MEDCIYPPPPPPLPESAPAPPADTERYMWIGVLRECVSALAIMLGAMEEQEAAYLQ